MTSDPRPGDDRLKRWYPGGMTLAMVLAFYGLCVAVATYPYVCALGTKLPSLGDPLEHLWIIRWYASCLFQGHAPWVSPNLQYPVGSPLGYYAPMHWETLLYLVFHAIVPNDVWCYNLIWLCGLLGAGLGTFLLVWQLLGNRLAACYGGLAVMLATPMMVHAHGHLEIIQLGGVPLFLAGWLRFVDRPSGGRLVVAALLYLLVVMSAPYYVVLVVVPAVLYVLVGAWRAGRTGAWSWLRPRLPWLFGFAAVVGPGLLFLFAPHIWAAAHGHLLLRPRSEFNRYGAPWWSYLVPTVLHTLGRSLPIDVYKARGYDSSLAECGSYLGVVTIALLAYTASVRVRFAKSGYWWLALGVLMILSWGGTCRFAGRSWPLPAGWLWDVFFPFRWIRVPARFNLFASVAAAVLAAAGLKHLLVRLPGRTSRAIVFTALCALTVADLAMVPFHGVELPPMPACYTFIKQRDPQATILEIPHFPSGGSAVNSICGYWGLTHGLPSTAGYTGHANLPYDNLLFHSSPFNYSRMLDPQYLERPDAMSYNVIPRVDFRDYAWLYLKAHNLKYVVLHKDPQMYDNLPLRLDRVMAELSQAKVFEDAHEVVYESSRLAPPSRLVYLCTKGWRQPTVFLDRVARPVERQGRIVVYNPSSDQENTLALEVRGFAQKRRVRLVCQGVEVARWEVPCGPYKTLTSPRFRLPGGLQELTVECDGEAVPRYSGQEPIEGDRHPFSLHIVAVKIEAVPADVPQIAVRPSGSVSQ